MKFFLNFSVLFVSLLSCSNSQQPNDPIPAHETFTIDSKYVNEKRVITVWFPDEYKNSTDSLPVLYMPDGGINEDFPHIANTLSDLIKASLKDIQPKAAPPAFPLGTSQCCPESNIFSSGVILLSSSAAVPVAILKVEPGGYSPLIALLSIGL